MRKNVFLLFAVILGVLSCKTQQTANESLKDALKDYPTVSYKVMEKVISLTGEIRKSDLPKLLQKVSALKPVKIDNQLIIE